MLNKYGGAYSLIPASLLQIAESDTSLCCEDTLPRDALERAAACGEGSEKSSVVLNTTVRGRSS